MNSKKLIYKIKKKIEVSRLKMLKMKPKKVKYLNGNFECLTSANAA